MWVGSSRLPPPLTVYPLGEKLRLLGPRNWFAAPPLKLTQLCGRRIAAPQV
jgi:hypothetical protein